MQPSSHVVALSSPVHPGDEHLPLVVVDEEPADHLGDFQTGAAGLLSLVRQLGPQDRPYQANVETRESGDL